MPHVPKREFDTMKSRLAELEALFASMKNPSAAVIYGLGIGEELPLPDGVTVTFGVERGKRIRVTHKVNGVQVQSDGGISIHPLATNLVEIEAYEFKYLRNVRS